MDAEAEAGDCVGGCTGVGIGGVGSIGAGVWFSGFIVVKLAKIVISDVYDLNELYHIKSSVLAASYFRR